MQPKKCSQVFDIYYWYLTNICFEPNDNKYPPERMAAKAAIMNDIITAGPATFSATIPATTYIPVPQQLPTPREIKSKVESTFCSSPSSAVEAVLPFSASSTLAWDMIVLVRRRRRLKVSKSPNGSDPPSLLFCGAAMLLLDKKWENLARWNNHSKHISLQVINLPLYQFGIECSNAMRPALGW